MLFLPPNQQRQSTEGSLTFLFFFLHWFGLQCFDTVGWASGRVSGLYKLSDEVLVWLSVWSLVQIVAAIPKPHHLLPHLNPDWFLPRDAMHPRY